MITLEERAAEFREVVSACTLCPLSVTRTKAVPGEGPLTAEVMCIGEAPGVNEDKQGMPFVGAAGNFLTELLAAGGLKREDVYICNVLKCRPPSNRDPMPDEIQACSEYLDLQLDMVDPLVVITLGRFSMAKWFPQQTISRIHGSVKEDVGRLIVPMYHPAAALHQGSLRQVLLDDFAKLPAILARAKAMRATGSDAPTRSPDSASLTDEGQHPGPAVEHTQEPKAFEQQNSSSSFRHPVRHESEQGETEASLPAIRAPGPQAPGLSAESASLAGEGESDAAEPFAERDSPSILPSPAGYESGEENPSPAVRAESPADHEAQPNGVAAGPRPTQELTAEQAAASAAKSAQLSLYE